MTVAKLNEMLGRSLGRTIWNESTFQWRYSEDLIWPAHQTGRMVRKKILVPLIGSDKSEEVETDIPTPEYVTTRMSYTLHRQWVVCKWIAPDKMEIWHSMFPGADWPAQGYYYPTNACLDPDQRPTLADTERFIKCVKAQNALSLSETVVEMERTREREDKSMESEADSMIRDSFTAYLNHAPGKRGSFVSTPYTKFDREAPKKEIVLP